MIKSSQSQKSVVLPSSKKSPTDVNTALSDVHLKTLRRCRTILSKDLSNPLELLDALPVEDVPFKSDLREVLLNLRTRESRVTALLDRLEASDERTFCAFMTVTRDHYRHLHSVLEETMKTLADSDGRVKERTQIAGETIRQLLKDVVNKPVTDRAKMNGRIRGGPFLSEVQSEDDDDEQYVNCYVVATRGRMTRGKWIKHSSVLQEQRKRNNVEGVGAAQDEAEENVETETGYMAVTNRDVMFRIISRPFIRTDISESVPATCERVYVIDDECRYSPMTGYGTPGGAQKDILSPTEGASTAVKHRRSDAPRRKVSSPRLNFVPPPLPPKPSNLPVVISYPDGTTQLVDEPLRQCNGGGGGWTPGSSSVQSPPVPVRQARAHGAPLRLKLQPPSVNNSGTDHHVENTSTDVVHSSAIEVPNKNNVNLNSGLENTGTVNVDYNLVHFNVNEEQKQDLKEIKQELTEDTDKSAICENGTEICDNDYKEDENRVVGAVVDEDLDNEDDDISLNYNVDLEEEEDYRYEPMNSSEQVQRSSSLQVVPLAIEEESTEPNELDSSSTLHACNERSTEAKSSASLDNVATKKMITAQLSMSSTEPHISSDSSVEVTLDNEISTRTPHDSGVADTEINTRMARDSGVGSAMSHGITEVPSTPDAVVDLLHTDKLLSASLGDLEIHASQDDGDKSSIGSSYYEDIELVDGFLSPSIYLDPQSGQTVLTRRERERTGVSAPHLSSDYKLSIVPSDRKILSKGTLFIITSNTSDSTSCVPEPRTEGGSTGSNEFVLGYDKDGMIYYLPRSMLNRYGDPTDENWFYPVEISAREASLFLSRENQMGCFIVYRPQNKTRFVLYHLSLCRGDGLVVHYRIVKNSRGDVAIEGHDHSFMTVHDLVKYFKKNQSRLATRLRRSLKEARLPITAGYHYPLRLDIQRNAVKLTGKIIGQGKFGALCEGQYRGATVTVKVLQRDPTTLDEDDFLDEALVISSVKHDNIVKLHGICCTVLPFYIVTEFFERGTLKNCLKNNEGMLMDDVDALFDVCIQTVSALTHLESLQFVLHRDVSAHNFLVTNDMLVKLTNFERARSVLDDDYQASSTEDVIIQWAAPEVLTDSTYSTKSDVWSLGVVFWEVFSRGADPYSRLELDVISSFVVEGGRLEKPLGCPHDLFSIMKSCWQHSPNHRPSFASLSDKIKGKSNAYYMSVVRDRGTTTTDKVVTSTAATATRTSMPLPTKTKSPVNHRLVTSMIVESSSHAPEKSPRVESIASDRRGGGLSVAYPRRTADLGPTSSSDSSSIISASVVDLKTDTRTDKLRRSIRKLIRKKTPSNASSLAAKNH